MGIEMAGGATQRTACRARRALLLCTVLAGATARADQATPGPSKDNTIYAEGNLSNGKGSGLFAGVTNGGSTRRALLAFDVAGVIPAGSTITSAQLVLRVTRSKAGTQTMTLYRLAADWGEGASVADGNGGAGGPAAQGDATWRSRFFGTQQQWSAEGGDFTAQASAMQQAGDSGTVTWGSTAQMVADVQGWLDAPGTNFGWIVRGNETHNQTTKRFASRESSASNRPKLTIVFSLPDGGATATPTATLAPSATVSVTATHPPPSATATATSTRTRTATMTAQPTSTVTVTVAATGTATIAPSTTITATHTATVTLEPTGTTTGTFAPTGTATVTVAPSATPSATVTGGPPPTDAATATGTVTATPLAPTPTATDTPPARACLGDCDGGGAVSISELITGVNIALGSLPLDRCPAFDPSGNGGVEINELIAAVNDALNGCPGPVVRLSYVASGLV